MTAELNNILKTLSEKESEEVISFFVKLKSMNVKNISYNQFKAIAMLDIRSALHNKTIQF